MKYKVDLERELNYTELSIASTELSSSLSILGKVTEIKDYTTTLEYAKQLQQGLYNMELELKRRLRVKDVKTYDKSVAKTVAYKLLEGKNVSPYGIEQFMLFLKDSL